MSTKQALSRLFYEKSVIFYCIMKYKLPSYCYFVLPGILCLLLFFFSCASTTQPQEKEVYLFTSFHEPADEGLRFLFSEDGYHWDSIDGVWLKPTLGKHQLMRDPSMVKGPDGFYHLVWTTSWKGDLGFGYARSKDLINWSEPKMITAMTDTTTVNVWAPEVFYDDTLNLYFIVWASCVPGVFERGIEEEDNNHRLYYLTTPDFETFSETKLFLDPGFSVIDAMIVKRNVDDYVLVLKDNTRLNRNIKVAFAKSPYGPYSTPSEPFTPQFCEGPTTTKVGDDYLIYFDMYKEKRYGAVRTTDFVQFEDVSDLIRVPKGHKHGTIVKVPQSLVENLKKEVAGNASQ